MVEINWNYTFIEDFYDRVRALLNNASNTLIPNEKIDYHEKAPTAEFMVKSKILNWTELDESKFAIFETAIVYLTASFFENYVLSQKARRKELPSMSIEYYSKETNIMPMNGMSLKDYSDMLIGQILGEDNSVDFIGFMVTD